MSNITQHPFKHKTKYRCTPSRNGTQQGRPVVRIITTPVKLGPEPEPLALRQRWLTRRRRPRESSSQEDPGAENLTESVAEDSQAEREGGNQTGTLDRTAMVTQRGERESNTLREKEAPAAGSVEEGQGGGYRADRGGAVSGAATTAKRRLRVMCYNILADM